MGRYDYTHKAVIFVFIVVFAIFFIGFGVFGVVSNALHYNLPIYISQNFSINGYYTYSVSGEITNSSQNDIQINKLVLCLTGSLQYDNYSVEWQIDNIFIPANGSVSINENDLKFDNWYGGEPAIKLTKASIKECVVNDENWEIKFSNDGKNFNSEDGNIGLGIILIVLGAIILLVAIIVLIIAMKNDDWYF